MDETPELRPPRRLDWIAAMTRVLVVIIAIIVTVGIGVWWVATLTILGGLTWLVHWHARNFGYRCPRCSAEFTVSEWSDLASPQALDPSGVKYLRCPECGQRAWMPVLRRRRPHRHSHPDDPGTFGPTDGEQATIE